MLPNVIKFYPIKNNRLTNEEERNIFERFGLIVDTQGSRLERSIFRRRATSLYR